MDQSSGIKLGCINHKCLVAMDSIGQCDDEVVVFIREWLMVFVFEAHDSSIDCIIETTRSKAHSDKCIGVRK